MKYQYFALNTHNEKKKGKMLTSNFFCYIFCVLINNVERMGLLKLRKQTKLRAK